MQSVGTNIGGSLVNILVAGDLMPIDHQSIYNEVEYTPATEIFGIAQLTSSKDDTDIWVMC